MTTVKAGRELDALVAEKLFGWTWLRHTIRAKDKNKREWDIAWWRSLFTPNHEVQPFNGPHGMENVAAIGDEPIGLMNAPHYSTDIAEAWPLVERFGFTVQPAGLGTDGQRCWWRVGFTYAHPSGDMDLMCPENPTVGQGGTAPLAISLAALKAVEAQS